MNKELHLGFMSIEELAEWGGVSAHYMGKNKKSWCTKNLEKNATYNLIRGGVEILEIKDPLFNPSTKKRVEKEFDPNWGYGNYKVDTCVNAATKIYNAIGDPTLNMNTVYAYTCATKREWYGIPKKQPKGIKGMCRWAYAKRIGGRPYPFTEEEDQIRIELMKKYLRTDGQSVVELQAAKTSLKRKEITQEEFLDIVQKIADVDTGWLEFQVAFESAIGCATDFFTEIEPCAWGE